MTLLHSSVLWPGPSHQCSSKIFLPPQQPSKTGVSEATPSQEMFLNLSSSGPAKENTVSKELSSIACGSFRGVYEGSPVYGDEMSFLEQCGGWYLLGYIQQCLVYELSLIMYCGVQICALRVHKRLTRDGPSPG